MIHRDDVPYRDLEKMEAEIQKKNPGAKLIFLGDIPESQIPDEIKQKLAEEERASEDSVDFGYCLDCDASIEELQDYDPTNPNWTPPPGWRCYAGYDGRVLGWRCDVCQEVWLVAHEIDENERWTVTGKSPDNDEDVSDGPGDFWNDLEGFDGK